MNLPMKLDEQDDWHEQREPQGLGKIEEAADNLATILVGFVIAGILYTFWI
jgi:hypothetical protein